MIHTIALTLLNGLSRAAAAQLYHHYGSGRAVYEHRGMPGTGGAMIPADWNTALARAEEELTFCRQHGIRIFDYNAPDYPARLRECPDAPLVLFYKGNADFNRNYVISVVGTRKISEYGKSICQSFITELHTLIPDALIVSGLAYGVDVHAHRACLAAGLDTVGVLAHGLDRLYPASHRDTARKMVAAGGLLTEYVTTTVPDKGNFVRRNRIVAGIADATVVVESAAKGGALITARLAQDYNRDVFAFPGRIGDKCSEGCNALIRDNGAGLATSALDVVKALGWHVAEKKTQPVQRELFPELTEEQQALCAALNGTDGRGLNELAIALNWPVQRISALLFDLEMTGMVRQMAGGRYRLA